MSEGEMAKLMEEVEEKKKLIATIRSKPWRMKRRLTHLKRVFKKSGTLLFWFNCWAQLHLDRVSWLSGIRLMTIDARQSMAVAPVQRALEPSRFNQRTIELKQNGAALDVS